MKLAERFWATFTYIVSTLTLNPHHNVADQQVILPSTVSHAAPAIHEVQEWWTSSDEPGPIFQPPTGAYGDPFECDYSAMEPYWKPCSTPWNRGCWLKHNVTGEEYNIETDYEFIAPIGKLREYNFDLVDNQLNADGLLLANGKFFDNEYPGPWVQACWGDTVHVTINNKLKWNGTSVHFHGIRQNQTMHMDGVNGVTQCAVAPDDSFLYAFDAVQYGTTWYHSHYSVQYADGALGPLTIHGPSSGNYTHAREPILMTDWGHNSAFESIHTGTPIGLSILLNGRGNITKFTGKSAYWQVPETYNITFNDKPENGDKPNRYLLRLINTSFDSTFIFSIDNHELEVVQADLVPIVPYKSKSILVGIGQRYHVIVEAKPIPNTDHDPTDGNYWMRTWVASGCGTEGVEGYETTGILKYDASSFSSPTSSPWYRVSGLCADEPMENLVPIHKWKVDYPKTGSLSFEGNWGQVYNITTNYGDPDSDWKTKYYDLAHFDLASQPLRVEYNETILSRLHEPISTYPAKWVVIDQPGVTAKDWIWMVFQGKAGTDYKAHPMHLHGHDFAILAQVANKSFDPVNDPPTFKRDNPPRRDVALLPSKGYVAIAFKADNPGSWLVHCHIAYHASEGLGMQILERKEEASKMWPPGGDVQELWNERCNTWIKWQNDCSNWAIPCAPGPFGFHDDSGV